MIHHTVGVYANGSKKQNGVKIENLADHIKYNMVYRPGRALFVDSVCLNEGYLSKEECALISKGLKGEKVDKDTAPYI
jgi:hypothetical protein